jgi:hypothetical protein
MRSDRSSCRPASLCASVSSTAAPLALAFTPGLSALVS